MDEDARGWSSDPVVAARWDVLVAALVHQRNDPSTRLSVQDAGMHTGRGTAAAGEAYSYAVGQGLARPEEGLAPERYLLNLNETGIVRVGIWARLRENAKDRKIACRSALLDWLYALDAETTTTDPFLSDARASFFGKDFTANEVRQATEDLVTEKLATGITSWGGAPSRVSLTAAGRTCVEDFDGVISDWRSGVRQTPPPLVPSGDSYTFHVLGSHGTQIAAGNRDVRQQSEVSITGGGSSELVALVERLTNLTAALPLATTPREEVVGATTALAEEVASPQPDRGRIQRLLGIVLTAVTTVAAEAGAQEVFRVGGEIMQQLG